VFSLGQPDFLGTSSRYHMFKKDMQPFPELLQVNKYKDKFNPILQMMNDFTEKHLVLHLNSVDLCGYL
jgi:hypothetical protein